MRAKFVLLGVIGLGISGGSAAWEVSRVGIQQGYQPEQPIAFSHRLHAGENKIPCLYCHFGARTSRHAGIPPASVCMNCHSLIEKQTTEVEKLKEAVGQQRPIRWVKVHNLPDFVHFSHSHHVLSGVRCQQCHGPIESMDRVKQYASLTMGWCLHCHREHARLPTNDVERAVSSISHKQPLVPELDCASCHY
jgi:hypothetical protein